MTLTAMSMAEDERTKNIFSGTWSFNKREEIFSAVESQNGFAGWI